MKYRILSIPIPTQDDDQTDAKLDALTSDGYTMQSYAFSVDSTCSMLVCIFAKQDDQSRSASRMAELMREANMDIDTQRGSFREGRGSNKPMGN